MTSGPPSASDPQSAPRDIPAMPEPDRPREGDDLHWPDVPINEVPAAEREALMAQAGPVGESARLAWNAYQEGNPSGEDDASVARERTRLADLGQAPPAEPAAPKATATTKAPEGAQVGPGVGAPAEDGNYSRAEAEKRAKARGLEVRDFGTGGDWRVYDTATGRQVSKTKLDEPV